MRRGTRVSALSLVLGGCGSASVGGSVCLEEGSGSDDDDGADDGCLFLPGCPDNAETGDDSSWGGKTDIRWVDDLPPVPDLFLPGDPPPPPPTWSYHSDTDTFHRFATESERDVHGWAEGTVLLSAGALVDGLVDGVDAPLVLGVPVVSETPDGVGVEIEPLTIARVRSERGIWQLESRELGGRSVVRAFRPEFHTFLPTWVDLDALDRGEPIAPPELDVFAAAYGDSHGGVAIHAMTPSEDRFIAGPAIALWLESPAPDRRGVLVAEPEPRAGELDELLDHWVALASVYCANAGCSWEPDAEERSNCRDCVDNDRDGSIDAADLGCVHRRDFGCDDFGDHDHRWEDSKDFAAMPDIEWCTRTLEDDTPWQTQLYARASQAAMLLDAVPVAARIHPDFTPPDRVPRIRYRFASCVFAETLEDAADCVETGDGCPAGYALGGVTKTLETGSQAEREYFRRMWDEFDRAMHGLELEGVRPKPVAMLWGIYSGDLEPNTLVDAVIGRASSIGNINPHIVTGGVGAMTLEAEFLGWVSVAHELGHLLGLSHTLPDPYYGEDGFMKPGTPVPAHAILGPSLEPEDGYKLPNQWTNWIERITDKEIPRPNAFGLSGCNDDGDCPSQLRCWNASPDGFCRSLE